MAAPCDWDITVDETCCTNWAALPAEQQQRAITYATAVMWAATGRRFGLCEVTTRPCGNDRRCGECGSWTVGYGGWMRPYILDGLWRNCLCACECTCKPHCQITLPGPVDHITQVLIDGVILAPSSYRVDDNQYLVRTDGDCWPRCQDYNVDVPAEGTLQVTYGRGDPIPQAVLDAAAIIACEYGKLCAGGDCRLPGRLTSIARQGVNATFTDIDTLLQRGLTGIPEVDQVIVAYNPYALKARPFFHSFDTSPRTRTVTSA